MEKYEVISVIGEGSFGRVYKAKVQNSNECVALKLIVKKGRTEKEIKGLNQECEILRRLDHPNIIPMKDSFETDTEIVVITEFVDRELYEILGKEGYLQEDHVRKITCDLVSALYYLHSNRVLHRDLKPQNVLIDSSGAVKLCDFGFARCMGLSTHVLTSIKGTPLYMAPELIDGRPYGHTADLWSLGCIVYELLVGAPPFSTSSILQLVQLIQHKAIVWPDFISDECRLFLQGLLQKQPENRMTWQKILNHPFLQNGVLNVESDGSDPFANDNVNAAKPVTAKADTRDGNPRLAQKLLRYVPLKAGGKTTSTLHSWDSAASARPIENEEWLAFLQRNMEEIIAGQLECLRNHNLVSVIVAPLRNSNASPRVLEYVANMLSLPFVVDGPVEKDLDQIRQVYLEIKVIPNLVYASKIIARRHGYDSEASSPSVLPDGSDVLLRPVSELSAEELQVLESIYLLVCHLVHSSEDFLLQFCDAAAILNTVTLMQQFLLLGRRKVRIVTDLLAILNLILRDLPDNAEIVEQIVVGSTAAGKSAVDLSRLLTHPSGVVRSRTCELVRHLCGACPTAVHTAWTQRLDQDLHALLSDSVPTVRMAAEEAYQGVKGLAENKTG